MKEGQLTPDQSFVVDAWLASFTVSEMDVSGLGLLYGSLDRLLPLRRKALTVASIYRALTALAYEVFPASEISVTVEAPGQGLIVKAARGRRPSMMRPGLHLPQLAGWAEAWETRRPRLLQFEPGQPPGPGDWRRFSSSAIARGVMIPFLTAGRTRAALLLGEQRRSERAPITPAAEAALLAIVRRAADLLSLSHLHQGYREAAQAAQSALTSLSDRQRLARELHDSVGQPLSGLLMKIRAAKVRGYAAIDELNALEMYAEEATEAVHSVAQGLRALVPTFGQLASARRYAETILASSGCSLSWTDRLGDTVLDPGLLREVASVIKESVTNIVRHARARTVTVDLSLGQGQLRVAVEDDGIGLGTEL